MLSPFQTASSSGDPHVHIVKGVDSADEGLYTCIAGNVLGQAWMDSLSPSFKSANVATKSPEFLFQNNANRACVIQRSAKVLVRGLVKFVPALA